jgi:hypothetical protein
MRFVLILFSLLMRKLRVIEAIAKSRVGQGDEETWRFLSNRQEKVGLILSLSDLILKDF